MPKKSKLTSFHGDEEKFRAIIIEKYLPQLLKNEITIEQIEGEMKTTGRTINNVIEEYYQINADEAGKKAYEEAKKRNIGTTVEKRETSKKAILEVRTYQIVGPKQFRELSNEEQVEQLKMKVRNKISVGLESGADAKKSVPKEETVEAKIERTTQYFRGKNIDGIENFSEREIRQIIFEYPEIVKRLPETLEDKLDAFRSCEAIGEETAYQMIKKYPRVLSCGIGKINENVDLLEKEGLIGDLIEEPKIIIISNKKMKNLIEEAKLKYPGEQLSELKASSIFLNNSEVKDESKHAKKGKSILERIMDESKHAIKVNPYSIGLLATADQIDILTIEESARVLGTDERQRG